MCKDNDQFDDNIVKTHIYNLLYNDYNRLFSNIKFNELKLIFNIDIIEYSGKKFKSMKSFNECYNNLDIGTKLQISSLVPNYLDDYKFIKLFLDQDKDNLKVLPKESVMIYILREFKMFDDNICSIIVSYIV
jgi:hypothetical protein